MKHNYHIVLKSAKGKRGKTCRLEMRWSADGEKLVSEPLEHLDKFVAVAYDLYEDGKIVDFDSGKTFEKKPLVGKRITMRWRDQLALALKQHGIPLVNK